MSEQILDYRSPNARLKRPPSDRVVYVAAIIAALTVIITNTVYVIRIVTDKGGWGIPYYMIIAVPSANGIIFLLTLALIPLVRYMSRGAPLRLFVLAGVLLPISVVLIDAAVILTFWIWAVSQPVQVQVHHPP